jgi:hypothetical protein
MIITTQSGRRCCGVDPCEHLAASRCRIQMSYALGSSATFGRNGGSVLGANRTLSTLAIYRRSPGPAARWHR